MLIGGVQELTTLDFPGAFGGGGFSLWVAISVAGIAIIRNLWTRNKLKGYQDGKYSEEVFFQIFGKEKGEIGGVCVSGGEPTLQPDIVGVRFKNKTSRIFSEAGH